MAWSVSADPVDFEEAIAWFRKRVAISKAEFRRLTAAKKRRAFTVANVAQLDLVNHAWKAIDKAIANGTTLEDFKREIGPDLRKAWAGKVGDPAWRLETIFRTNVQSAYAAGRHKQATHPDVLEDRPVWMFDAILDGRETEICHACDGTKRPANDPFWQTHTPPLHHNCRSSVIALSEDQTRNRGGITPKPTTKPPQAGFGLTPGADEWSPDTTKYPTQLAVVFAPKQAKAPPPPPAPRLKARAHFARLRADALFHKDQVDALLESVSDAETLAFLEKQPLGELNVAAKPKYRRKEVNGIYHPRSKKLTVDLDRPPGRSNQPWKPGETWSISSSALTREMASQITLRHEIAHHIHMFDGHRSKVDLLVARAYGQAKARSKFLTRYAETDRFEYFAECYTAYYYRRADLKKHDPDGFAMVEEVLRERGILS